MNSSCNKTTTSNEVTALDEEFLYRPNFHFTPKANWMNDPNGMFYLNGQYHLFFQYYPDGNVWGPMHWGHAISKDLIAWEEQDIALYPDELGYIFSGSAVVDHNNTSGFGDGNTPPVVAIFTYHDPDGEKRGAIDFQTQGIAYSLDEGKTWTKYEGNPVIPNPGIKDFRDPKVIWDQEREQWIMVLATYEETLFYASNNLKEWRKLSSFGKGLGAHGGVWECPDFFPMTIEGSDTVKWVLLQSLNPGSYNGGSGTQYFIGDFDGKEFKLDEAFKHQLAQQNGVWLDFGRDNYAGVTWSNVPETDGRKLFIGWMSNWDYAQITPTTTWRSAMTIPRNLKLLLHEDWYTLRSIPVKELKEFETTIINKNTVDVSQNTILFERNEGIDSHLVELNITDPSQDYTMALCNNNEVLYVSLDFKNDQLVVDRSGLGTADFSEKFAPTPSTAPLQQVKMPLKMEVLLDKTSIEIFLNDGAVVFTERFWPNKPLTTLKISSTEQVTIALKVNAINP